MLVELSVMEQRYHAVMEVVSGAPVSEVARRYGVSRQAVHGWLSRYERDGLAGLADHSHRPHRQPRQLDAEIEALICRMRGAHPRWGPRRLLYELGKARVSPLPSRSTIYRVLVRHHLVPARRRKRRRQDYKRWQREEPMQLWQMDVTGSVFLADGTELKLISGLDDCSRFCVIATVVRRATGRAVCRAFVAAMRLYGIPDELLTDNGKVFTGRFGKPRPAEVLFERICRKNGIRQLLTKPYSPTTIGKVERWHQTLQTDFLTDAGPFATIEAAQAAVDAWRHEYNHDRPHQSLGMATDDSYCPPATRCRDVSGSVRSCAGQARVRGAGDARMAGGTDIPGLPQRRWRGLVRRAAGLRCPDCSIRRWQSAWTGWFQGMQNRLAEPRRAVSCPVWIQW
jgi:transposase InsO family protein